MQYRRRSGIGILNIENDEENAAPNQGAALLLCGHAHAAKYSFSLYIEICYNFFKYMNYHQNIEAGFHGYYNNLDSRITTLAFRNPAITIATFGEQAMD